MTILLIRRWMNGELLFMIGTWRYELDRVLRNH